MLFHTQLAEMRLGCHTTLAAPIQPIIGAARQLTAYGRIVGTQRVQGQNNVYPDCVPTGYCNYLQAVKARQGDFSPIADDVPLSIYKIFDPTLTTGMVPEDLLAWGMQNAVAGWKLKSWSRIDHTDETAVRSTAEETGGVALVAELAIDQQNQRVWEPTSGLSGQPGSWGGHFEFSDGFDGAITSGTSWGEPAYIDRSYFAVPGYIVGAYSLRFVKGQN